MNGKRYFIDGHFANWYFIYLQGTVFISYILIDVSGWVISDVSFGFIRGFGSCNIRPPHPNDPVGIDLTPTPIPSANLRIHTRKKKMTTEMALYIILQQPIRAKLFWWLLNLSFKNREATLLLLFCHIAQSAGAVEYTDCTFAEG